MTPGVEGECLGLLGPVCRKERKSEGLRSPRSLPTTKRVTRQKTMNAPKEARVAFKRLGILGAAGTAATGSSPAGEKPGFRRGMPCGLDSRSPSGLLSWPVP